MAKSNNNQHVSKKDKRDTIIILSIFGVALLGILITVIFSVVKPMIQKSKLSEGLYEGQHQYFEDLIFIPNGSKKEVYLLENNEDGTKSEITLPMESVNLGKVIENVSSDTLVYYFTYNDKKYIVNFKENVAAYHGLRIENNTFLVSYSMFDKIFKVNLDDGKFENLLSDSFEGKTKSHFQERASINKKPLAWGINPILTDDGKYVVFASNRIGISLGTDDKKDIFVKDLETGKEKMIFDHHYAPVRYMDNNKMLFLYTPDNPTVSNNEFILYDLKTGEKKTSLSITKDAFSKTNMSFPYLINKLENDNVLIRNAAYPEDQKITINVPGIARIFSIYSNKDRSKSIIGYNLKGHPTDTKFFTLIDWKENTYKHLDIEYYKKGFAIKSCYFTRDNNIGVNLTDQSKSYNYYTTLDNLKERGTTVTAE